MIIELAFASSPRRSSFLNQAPQVAEPLRETAAGEAKKPASLFCFANLVPSGEISRYPGKGEALMRIFTQKSWQRVASERPHLPHVTGLMAPNEPQIVDTRRFKPLLRRPKRPSMMR
jgi:hypothetical protein